jgi:hypothetical protein
MEGAMGGFATASLSATIKMEVTMKKKKDTLTTKPAAENAGEVLEEGQSEQLQSNHTPVQWKPWLDSYQDLRALQFRTPEHFAAATTLLWIGELRDLPYDLVGNRTIIVPAEAVLFFRGLEVTETDVLNPGDVPPQELSDLRKEQGPY